MRWDEFTTACPELAALARNRFERDQIVLLGTIRRDGRPRISPCEPDFAAGRLLFGMMWQSPKAADLLRDARLTVHSVPSDRMNAAGDVKLYGIAIDEPDAMARGEFHRAIRARIDWEPKEPYHLFSLDVTEGAFMRFTETEKETWRWTSTAGLRKERGPNA
jgi:hypothetical protein